AREDRAARRPVRERSRQKVGRAGGPLTGAAKLGRVEATVALRAGEAIGRLCLEARLRRTARTAGGSSVLSCFGGACFPGTCFGGGCFLGTCFGGGCFLGTCFG